jgi:DNA-directed RNA polymerase subunit E'/Rpb7
MSKTTVVVEIPVKPEYLSRDLRNNLVNEIKKLEGTCSHEYGYVVSVDSDSLSIVDNKITSSNSDIVFTVKVCVDAKLPKVGEVYTCTVKIIRKECLIMDIETNLRVLVNEESLMKHGYTYCHDYDTQTFVMGKTSKVSVGDKFKVLITFVNFTNKKINCFGELV